MATCRVNDKFTGMPTRHQTFCIRLETNATTSPRVTMTSDLNCIPATRMIIWALKVTRILASTNDSGKDGSLPRICKPPLPIMANTTSAKSCWSHTANSPGDLVKNLTTRSKTTGIVSTCAIQWRERWHNWDERTLSLTSPVCHSLHITSLVRH